MVTGSHEVQQGAGGFDLVLAGGHIIDPADGKSAVGDVGIIAGRIASSNSAPHSLAGVVTHDVSGMFVVPGLIDIHTHVFAGQDLGVDADDACLTSGVTLAVDAGSAGAHLMGAFVSSVRQSRVDVRAFVNLSTVGLTSAFLFGELSQPELISRAAILDCIQANPEAVVGIKVRADSHAMGSSYEEQLVAARSLADETALPIMIHIGDAPWSVRQMLGHLRSGDIVTHAFTGLSSRLIDERGILRPEVLFARDMGVFFDVGHGMASFDIDVAAALVEQQFLPDTISSDLHRYSRLTAVSLLGVMSKFLRLGLPLETVVRMVTSAPAAAIQALSGSGSLKIGSTADVAVIRLEGPGRAVGVDDSGGDSAWPQLRHHLTIKSGEVVARDGALATSLS